ncbi:hypothetical protein GMES_3576 [Paraglaciecola mesophila KMM 241]|uniref:Lipoprotein n=1 Tax=Paraglaciecola mesophila KMM 241 TaxID=1128912 RepID=K6ZA70_9ALTE|nr:hypothetical protein [Paraglaciecola mesophila]GAC25853.1 hypothetical protein GMES_3576 [Paraglaciecola mesophila KMM 241]
MKSSQTSPRPRAERYKPRYINRILVLLFTILISGCEIENDNRIGFGMSVDFLVSLDCMKATIDESEGINNLVLTDSDFFFQIENYRVTLMVQEQKEEKTSFELDIDGQHFEEGNDVFYQKADFIVILTKNTNKDIHL